MNPKSIVVGFVIALVLGAGMASALSNSSGGDWQYYREVTVKENSGTTLSDYQVLVELNSANFDFSKAKSDGSDIRFTDASGNELNYWIEEWNAGSRTAKIWVKVPSIPARGEAKLKMYYGNDKASAVSSTANTFITEIDGVIGVWNFDEGSGRIVYDKSGNMNEGAIYGASWANGKFGKALNLDGIDDYVEVPHPGYQSQGTIEGWVYFISVPSSIPSAGWMWFTIAGRPINQQYDGVDFGVHPKYSQNLVFGIYDGSWHWADSGIQPQSGRWYHFAGTWGSNGIKVYINGNLKGTNAYTKGIPSYTKYTYIGANTWGGYVNAIIDEIHIYNRALSSDEISDLCSDYGYTTTNYPEKIFARKYTTPEPTITLSAEFLTQKLPALSLTKSASPSTIQEGETATISIRVENAGSGDAKTVEVTDTIPTGFKIISGSKTESFSEIKSGDYRTFEYTLKATGSGKFTCDPATATYKDADGNSYSAASNSVSIQVGGEVPVGADSDGDGWSDQKEQEMGTNPYSVDSDSDGLKDPEDPNPTVPEGKKGIPGFEAVCAIAGLLAVAHVIRRRKRK